jgi:uncharacterized coiled-coil DUF342 family protein
MHLIEMDTEDIARLRDRIMELIEELGEERSLITAMREHIEKADEQVERSNEIIRQWVESLEMMPADESRASRNELIRRYNDLLNDHNELVRKWNRFVGLYNMPQAIGRPLQATEAQQVRVRKLRKAGHTLREIAHETHLSFQTIRTILGHKNNAHGAAKKKDQFRKMEVNRHRAISWRATKRPKDTPPAEINAVLKEGEGLVKDGRNLLKR